MSVGVASSAVLLAACSVVPNLAEPSPSPASSSSPAPMPSPTASPSAESDSGFPECDDDVVSGVDATVTAQLAAFAAEDFRTALGYASEVFRSSVTLKSFREIITREYPEVADAAEHEVLGCRVTGMSTVSSLVSVTSASGSTAEIDYRLVLEPGGWRVDGASTMRVVLGQRA